MTQGVPIVLRIPALSPLPRAALPQSAIAQLLPREFGVIVH
jgi:hypothetical protein